MVLNGDSTACLMMLIPVFVSLHFGSLEFFPSSCSARNKGYATTNYNAFLNGGAALRVRHHPTRSLFSFISTSVAAPMYRMATPPDSLANPFLKLLPVVIRSSLFDWGLVDCHRFEPSDGCFSPAPFTMVVLSLSILDFLCRSQVVDGYILQLISSFFRNSCSSGKVAMSSNMAFLRHQNPGAFYSHPLSGHL